MIDDRNNRSVRILLVNSRATRLLFGCLDEIGFVHPKGVWVGNEEVNEMTVFAGKSDMAITLLLYPNNGANYLRLMPDGDEEDTLDRYDQFQRHA